ncbi:MAG: class I SAM-dependent methyltransferase [Coleofasciculaceae cyanobacterium SM2_3_26]|nr:class I SAM-dependent methyltransferase [Coleofasciculaceae cyanobacterium SM2_3_26]
MVISARERPFPAAFPDGSGLFQSFLQEVNDRHLRVLEIGSRVVSPGSISKQPLFPNAASYTGFDYYPDDNTDVVGDAHQLSRYFAADCTFEAIFSLSVFEHLAMPWVVVREINQLLTIGGITCHITHCSFPPHELPWDFWRFTDEGLKVLFSPAMGFEIVAAGYIEPVSIHPYRYVPSQEFLPLSPTFASVGVLARKVANPNLDRVKWDVSLQEVLAPSKTYPKSP